MNNIKTVLVTGGSGFIGANLVHLLAGSGRYKVVNLDLLTYAANPASLDDLKNHVGYVFIQGSILNRELVSSVFGKYKPVGIIHLAAETHVDRSIFNADDFVHTNIVGTYTMLSAALEYWQNLPGNLQEDFRFLHVSTDEVFGSLGESGYFSENTPYSPNSPYAASKASSDHLVRSFYQTYDFPALISNCSNNYGPYQFPEKLIPLMILKALSGESLPVYGDGFNVRDWIYVEDHCRALDAIFTLGKPGSAYLVGANNERRNIDLVKQICGVLDEMLPVSKNPGLKGGAIRNYSDLIKFVKDRPGHDRRYAINATRIRHELGWKPVENFESGLRKTVEWYISNPAWLEQAGGDSLKKWLQSNYSWRS